MSAPFCLAATALSTTKRESSTQPSEYSKPRLIGGKRALFVPNFMPLEDLSVTRLLKLS